MVSVIAFVPGKAHRRPTNLNSTCSQIFFLRKEVRSVIIIQFSLASLGGARDFYRHRQFTSPFSSCSGLVANCGPTCCEGYVPPQMVPERAGTQLRPRLPPPERSITLSAMKPQSHICLRTLFGLLNGLVWLLGCAVVGVAVWLRIAFEGYISLLPQHDVLSLDTVILMGGVLLFTTAFLGCCGAWCKNRCMLIAYFVLVLVLCLLELLCGMLGFFHREVVTESMQEELYNGIQHLKFVNDTKAHEGAFWAWETVQYQLDCCGVRSYEDWYNSTLWPGQDYVPHSCCLPPFRHIADCGKTDQISMWHQTGCFRQVEKWFGDRLHFVAIVAVCVALIQLFGLVSSMVLFCAAQKRAGYKTYKAEKSAPLL